MPPRINSTPKSIIVNGIDVKYHLAKADRYFIDGPVRAGEKPGFNMMERSYATPDEAEDDVRRTVNDRFP